MSDNEEVLRYLYRWGPHEGTVWAASTAEARRIVEAAGISSTSELFLRVDSEDLR